MSWPLAIARDEAVEQVATTLLPQASLLTRLVAKQARWTVTRSEGSVLSTLSDAPQRITTLAELEGLAQPTVTIMIKRLEERGWVARDRDACDGRVVLVTITAEGREALEGFREQYRVLLREHVAAMADEQVAELVRATQALAGVVESLQDDATG
jgi:DNA-binding MarR family transcriptional regulator